jgi:crotonobetaine/carnitine-CoA ligase
MNATDDHGPLGPTFDGMLALRARTHPDHVFLRFAEGDLTYSEAWSQSQSVAAGLSLAGVQCCDVVPVLLPNSREFALVWFALASLGANACLINTAFKGPTLAGALGRTGATTMVVHRSFAAAVGEATGSMPELTTVVDVGGDCSIDIPGVRHVPFELVSTHGGRPAPSAHRATDALMVLFTSGSTGPSKGCVLSHRYTIRQAELMVHHLGLRPDDVLYCPFPLFHIDATVLTVAPALLMGATAAIGERFSVSGFWTEVRRFGATVFDFMGATLSLLSKAPALPDDADNPVRLGWGVPIPETATEFEHRFGLQLVELYGSTDAGIPIYHPVDVPRRVGSCGRLLDSYEAELVDANGLRVPDGEVGELLLRPNEPSLMSDGYHGMPEATVGSRRNFWFHTGDLLRRDSEGWYYFVGRRAENIRRRGENISSFEVEEVVKLHPAVADAAAYGVPSELTEDDVMVAVVLRPGIELEHSALTEFCAERMARHMVPRYVDFVADLPRTPTEKVVKEALRARGVTPTTWDRESAAQARA